MDPQELLVNIDFVACEDFLPAIVRVAHQGIVVDISFAVWFKGKSNKSKFAMMCLIVHPFPHPVGKYIQTKAIDPSHLGLSTCFRKVN